MENLKVSIVLNLSLTTEFNVNNVVICEDKVPTRCEDLGK